MNDYQIIEEARHRAAQQAMVDTEAAYFAAKARGFESAAEERALLDARWEAIERLKGLGNEAPAEGGGARNIGRRNFQNPLTEEIYDKDTI